MRGAYAIRFNGRTRDYCGGVLMLLLGLGAVLEGLRYQVDSLRHMGPGFFPIMLGVILALLGLAIVLNAYRGSGAAESGEEARRPEWRGWLCILGGIAAFVALGTYGGLLPATFAIVFISAMGDRRNSVRDALALAVGISLICVAIFWWALKLQFPLFAWG